jgi:hypothetical protein
LEYRICDAAALDHPLEPDPAEYTDIVLLATEASSRLTLDDTEVVVDTENEASPVVAITTSQPIPLLDVFEESLVFMDIGAGGASADTEDELNLCYASADKDWALPVHSVESRLYGGECGLPTFSLDTAVKEIE